MKQQPKTNKTWHLGYQAGIADERKRIESFIVQEMTICHLEGTPTSRLTALITKMYEK